MNAPGADTPESPRRVLVLAPTAKDAEVSRSILAAAGIACVVCRGVEEVCREMERGGGAALLTQEALLADTSGCLAAALARQPPWSDFPLIVLTPAAEGLPKARAALEDIGHMTLMKRPVQIAALVSVVRAALRDRDRQYAMRDYVAEREVQAEALRHKDEQFRLALQTSGMGSWEYDPADGTLACTDACLANFGRAPGGPLTYGDFFEAILPADRPQVDKAFRRSLDDRVEFEAEYRVVWPDGSVHWILARGRAFFTPEGRPTRMIGMSLDVTQRRMQEDALRTIDRRKDEFLAMLAHELRNPLAAIAGAARVFDHPPVTEADWAWGRGVLERQVKQLSRLIDDLLDVSRINSGKIRLRREDVDVAAVAASTIEVVRPLIEERKHELSVSLAPGLPRLHADPTRVEQVLVNLLSNAAKYTENRGRIAFSAEAEGDHVVFKVRDNGMGIAPEKMPAMFELFAQGDRTLARSEGGLGIGLTLVKALTELHGGTVAASSRGAGLGSEFAVRLPAAASPTARKAPGGAGPASTPAPAPRKSGKNARVLVVDDNVDAARGLARLLRRLGHEVAVAHSGPEAIGAAREHRPELVLLDIGLPGMDGYQVAASLRGEEASRDAVLIAVTGYGQDQDRRRSEMAGFDHHLVKPVDYEALLSLIDQPAGGR